MVIDEVYRSTRFNPYRRRESLLAHPAPMGQLVHECRCAPTVRERSVPFGAKTSRTRAELSAMPPPGLT